ncbi:MAG: hypothetical protein DMG07_17270, partial [Acidobacteria bacterium]
MRKAIEGALLSGMVALLAGGIRIEPFSWSAPKPKLSESRSSPIAISSDDRFVWVANPDNDSVSVLEVGGDVDLKVQEIPVGDEPQCVAITPDDRKVYVTNMVSGTVSVIDANTRKVTDTIEVGTEPFGCALTLDGKKLYVANFSSDDVSVINTHSDHVEKTIDGVGPKPRGIAITDDPKGPGHDKVYVTQFLAQLRDDARPVDEKEGRDDGKEGRVTVIDANNNKILGTIVLNPLADTGFASQGSTLDRTLAPTAVVTGAFPNLLQSIVLKGNHAYLP